jgi:hypothetical protein
MPDAPMFSSLPVKASEMMGATVVNRARDRLGEIRELVVEPMAGRIVYAVLACGGFLGLGEKLLAVPFAAFALNITHGDYVLDVALDRLTAAPGFDPGHWPSMADESWHRQVHSFYDVAPPLATAP